MGLQRFGHDWATEHTHVHTHTHTHTHTVIEQKVDIASFLLFLRYLYVLKNVEKDGKGDESVIIAHNFKPASPIMLWEIKIYD